MEKVPRHHFNTIGEYHSFMGLPAPEHPLISLVDLGSKDRNPPQEGEALMVFDFYLVALKRNPGAHYRYGQQSYDFNEGVLFFMSPGQVFGVNFDKSVQANLSGHMLLIHPDFLWHTALAQKIKEYDYFSYATHEALHLSEKEEGILKELLYRIAGEYGAPLDRFSQDVIVAQLQLLLTYAERFYQRQFLTRRRGGEDLLAQLETILEAYFRSDAGGLPTVQQVAAKLHVSPGYLSGMLRTLTGRSTQEHIHDKLIAIAKGRLSTTNLTVSEIAYELQFEHPQSFSRLFKAKTGVSPLQFREGFN